jgi:hypothetical protein
MTEFFANHDGPADVDPESPSMTAELLAEPGLVKQIPAADQRIAAGEFHTLDELRNTLEAGQLADHAERTISAHARVLPEHSLWLD